MSRARTTEPTAVATASLPRAEAVPNLSRGRILEQAIVMLDNEGLPGLSMRRLAERLDAGAMSLYWYFSTKDDLLVAATDAVIGEITVADLPAAWDQALRQVLGGFRHALATHPWSAQIITDAPRIGPHGFRLVDTVIRILSEAGLSGRRLDLAVTMLLSYVLGLAVGSKVWNATTAHESVAALGSSSAALEGFPNLREYYVAAAEIEPQERFDAGLTAIFATLDLPRAKH